ncbi:hypothetical protein SETIT_8G148100v2 [Setaria italica]|uniref:Uncharacterized protein n=1 Tax=Setaria italica TaxID=4555 RepID=A0A368S7V9_SETIT|nr:hypothetical protein SETIT_8G148100v2 [Setaria italica]
MLLLLRAPTTNWSSMKRYAPPRDAVPRREDTKTVGEERLRSYHGGAPCNLPVVFSHRSHHSSSPWQVPLSTTWMESTAAPWEGGRACPSRPDRLGHVSLVWELVAD